MAYTIQLSMTQPSSSDFAALIPAAGAGTRLGKGPKAFVTVGGRSLLSWSVSALLLHCAEVVVALPDGLALPADVPAGVRAISGGKTRQESVRLLLETAQAEYVLIHDAARPFLAADRVQALQQAVRRTEAATLALPVADALVLGAEGPAGSEPRRSFWVEGVPREGLWSVQTPQGFRRELLQYAHAYAAAEGFSAADDAGLVARLGHAAELVMGDPRLFKVTREGDLALAEALSSCWE